MGTRLRMRLKARRKMLATLHLRDAAATDRRRRENLPVLRQPQPHKETAMSRTPLVILIGADKGGVGKTTVTRAVSDYLHARNAGAKLFDAEYPAGDLKRFVPAADVVDIGAVTGQMKIFDTVDGVTAVDIRAGFMSPTLRALDEAKLLEDVRAGSLNLALLHVIGPTDRSLSEIAEVAGMIGGGAKHILVKNHINESGFSDERFATRLEQMEPMTVDVPHLAADAYNAVGTLRASFDAFSRDAAQSRMLRGYVRTWLDAVWRNFDKVQLGEMVAAATR